MGYFGFTWGNQSRNSYIDTSFVRRLFSSFGNDSPQWVANGDEKNLFETTPQLFEVIDTKASMYSNGIFRHYRMNKAGDREEIKDSAVLDLLENPNPLQSRSEWMKEDACNFSVFGNSFMYGLKAFASSDLPSVIWNLEPELMQVEGTGKKYKQSKIDGIISKYILENGSKTKQEFDPSEILHFKTYNPNNSLIGLSPFVPLKMPISNIREAYALRNVHYRKKGALGFISNESKDESGKIPITPKEKENIEKAYTDDYGSRDGQRSVLISNAALKWNPTTFPMKDMMAFEEVQEDLRTIIDAYGLNEYLFGRQQGTTFANLSDGKKIAYQDGIIPFANNRAERITKFLGLDKKAEWLEIDYSHIEALQENEKEKAQTMKLKAEAITKLKSEGYTPGQIESILGIKLF